MAEVIKTKKQYDDLIEGIEDAEVKDLIKSYDVSYGLGNEASMGVLNDYFQQKLPSQQQYEQEPKQPEEHRVVGKGMSEASVIQAADQAHLKAVKEYMERHFIPKGKSPEELKKHRADVAERAEAHANRLVSGWYNVARTPKGAPVEGAKFNRLERIMKKDGLAAFWESMKPRVYTKRDIVTAYEHAAKLNPEDKIKAQDALSKYWAADEMEANYMAIRPKMKARAQQKIRDPKAWKKLVDEYMKSQGAVQVSGEPGTWEFPSTVKTAWKKTKVKAPGSWEEYLQIRKDLAKEIEPLRKAGWTGEAPDPTEPMKPVAYGGMGAESASFKVNLFNGMRDSINSAIEKEEKRSISKARQDDAASFYKEAREFVFEELKKQKIDIPSAGPGRKGSEQRAIWEALPEEKRQAWREARKAANLLARRKTERWDMAVYPEQREEELGWKKDDVRIGKHNFLWTDLGWEVQYDASGWHTKLFEDTNDLFWSIGYTSEDYGVAETPVMTVFRDTMAVGRLLTDWGMDFISYEVDEHGNPRDPSDLNYKMARWLDKKLIKTKGGDASAWDQLSGGIMHGVASVIPVAMEKETDQKFISGGGFFKDAALGVYHGKMVGEDFMELSATRRFYESIGLPDAPLYLGLAVDMSLPVTPWFAAKGGSKFVGKTFQGVDAAYQTGKLSDIAKAFKPLNDMVLPDPKALGKAGRILENPWREAQYATLAAVGRNIIRTARGSENIEDVASVIAKEARLPKQLGVRISDEILKRLDFSSTARLNKSIEDLRKLNWGKNSGIAELLDDIGVAYARLMKAKNANSVKGLSKDAQGLALIDEIAAMMASKPIKYKLFSDEFNRGVMMGYLSERITGELLNYIPNNWVMVTGDIIMPIDKWNRIEDKVKRRVASELKVDVIRTQTATESGQFKYRDHKRAADLMVKAFGKAKINNTPYLKKIHAKLEKGAVLYIGEFETIDSLLRGAIVKEAYKGTHRLKKTGAAWQRSKEAAKGKTLDLPNMAKDLYRGINPIERIKAMLEVRPPSAPAKYILGKGKGAIKSKVPENIPIETVRMWEAVTDELSKLDTTLRQEILAARSETGDPWEAMTLVMNRYAPGTPVESVMLVLFGTASKRGGFFGPPGSRLDWDTLKAKLTQHMREQGATYGEELNAFTPAAIVEAIAFMRKEYPRELGRFRTHKTKDGRIVERQYAHDQPAGMGKRKNAFRVFWHTEGANYKKIPDNATPAERAAIAEHNMKLDLEIASKTDYADAAVWSFLVNAKKSEIISEKVAEFAARNPELVIPVGKASIENLEAFRIAVREALSGMGGASPRVTALIERVARQAEDVYYNGTYTGGAINASDMRYIMGKIIEDLYQYGAGNFLTQQRLADAIMRRMGKLVDGKPGAEIVTARIPELTKRIRTELKRALPNESPEKIEELSRLIAGRAFTSMIEATTKQTIDTLMGNLSSAGFSARIDNTGVVLTDLEMSLTSLADDVSIMMPKWADAYVDPQEMMLFEDLLKQNANGMIEANLRKLRARDMDGFSYVMGTFGMFWDWTRRGTIGGLLGGYGPFGAFRFHGVNVVTAPLIMAITVPRFVLKGFDPRVMAKAATSFVKPGTEALYPTISKGKRSILKRFPSSETFFDWMANRFSKDPDKVLFVDKWGSPWTRARFEAAKQSSNFQYTQVSFEFRDSIMHELRRAASIDPTLRKAGITQQILRWFDPSNKSFWTRFAEEADMAYREAVFAAALKEGLPVAESSAMARAALLDYGAIPKSERDTISRGMLFYAFRRQMAKEVLSTFLRGGDDFRLLTAMIKFTMNQQKMSGSWERGEDWQRTRLFSKLLKEFDDVQNYLFGPGNPALESLTDMINVSTGAIDYLPYVGADMPRMSPGDILSGFNEGIRAHPAWALMWDSMHMWQSRGGYEKDQQMLRPEWVYLWRKTGYWQYAVEMFDLVPVDEDNRRTNEYIMLEGPNGLYRGSQYRFGSKWGRQKFLSFYYVTTMAGMNRVMRDWATSGIKGDDDPQMVWKRHGLGSAWAHLLGVGTVGEVPNWPTIEYTHRRKTKRELDAIKQ